MSALGESYPGYLTLVATGYITKTLQASELKAEPFILHVSVNECDNNLVNGGTGGGRLRGLNFCSPSPPPPHVSPYTPTFP